MPESSAPTMTQVKKIGSGKSVPDAGWQRAVWRNKNNRPRAMKAKPDEVEDHGHSRIRNLVIGSTTSEMMRSCKFPVLLLR